MPISHTETLFTRLKKANRLPSPPGTALRVLELCRSEDSDMLEIATTVMADPVLSGRLLRYANSAMTGLSREVTSVRDAVLYLGLRTVKLTALGFSLAIGMESTCRGFSLKRFWTQSIVTAVLARRFAAQFGADREEAFTAGLLSGIGQLALAHGIPEEYAPILEAAARNGTPLIEEERRSLGIDHIEFAGELLSQWNVPPKLVGAIVCRNRPEKADPEAGPLAQTLRVATTLTPLFVAPPPPLPELIRSARELVRDFLKLDEPAWRQIVEETLEACREAAQVFNVELDQSAVFDLYAEAQEEAVKVGLVAQLERSRALEANQDLLRRATTDALTGVANRARFDERLHELLAGVARGHGHFALLLFDIDHFKQFNDRYGHAVGDIVLARVAQTVQATLREVDLLARYGGEEFAILAPHTDQRGACTVAARARKCVQGLRVQTGGLSLQVTISIGLVLSSDYPTVPTAEQMLADVDRQLYRSKSAGRNTWSYLDRSASEVVRPAGLRR